MLIKGIQLKNFRQYKGKQKIVFSTNKEKNITVIKGGTGAGKTTLLEAFNWCLYGKLNLPNKDSLLTKELANKLEPNETEEVFVEINLIHNNKEYIIKRLHSFMKLNSGELDRVSKIEKVQYKKSDGTLVDVDKEEIYNILPDELSTYFFFDGERIENLSKANRAGKKDISNAVKNILGLDILLNAQKHLKKIIKEFEDEYNEDNSEEMTKMKNKLEELRNEKEKIDQLIDTKKEEEAILKRKIENLNEKIKKNASAQKDQQLREDYEQQIINAKEDILSLKKDIEKNNKNSFPEFLANKLINLCSDKINLSDIQTKGILGIDGSAIETIIDRNECICGQEIIEGNE
ncbi:MAG: AAA family ATPase, partial [Candidatus Woesearchaeota archaeon]